MRVVADAGLVVGQQPDQPEVRNRVEQPVEIAPTEGAGPSTDSFGDIEPAHRTARGLLDQSQPAGRCGWQPEGRLNAELEMVRRRKQVVLP